MVWIRHLIALACLLWSVTSLCDVIQLTDPSVSVAVVPHAELCLDPSRSQSLQQVIQQDEFKSHHMQEVSTQFTHARIWFRFTINNPLPSDQQRVLYLQHFLMDEIVLYQSSGDGFSARYSGREHLDQHNQSALPTRFFHFELDIPAHSQQEYYLSITSEDAISSTLDLVSPEQFQRVMTWDTIWITLYSGLILTNLLFALFMLISLREIQLVYYIAFLLLHHVAAILMLEGVPARAFGIENLFWNKTGLIFLINSAITSALLFATAFLQLKARFPRYYRLSRVLLFLMVICIIQGLVLPHIAGALISSLLLTIVGASILAICIKCASKKDPVAQLFLLSWSAGIGGATIYSLKIWGLLPVNAFTNNAWHIGTAVEAILFSYTIAHRVTIERRMRLETQTELAHHERELRLAQEKLLQNETAAKIELEREVQERTQDITRILAELEHQNQQLVELSINDGLTKVRNRRYFNETYPKLWQDAMEQNCPIGIVMFDIDHFKSVNDRYGHLAGDQCLIKVAELMRHMISRPKDVICRYGGEEFIILLFDTDLGASHRVAERLRQKTSELAIRLNDGSKLHVTASLGVGAAVPAASLDPLEFIDQCDQALYQSKANGRNRVTVVESVEPEHQSSASNSASTSR